MKQVAVLSLYKFETIKDTRQFKEKLLPRCVSLDIKGTFIIASEGINGTVAGEERSINSIAGFLKNEMQLGSIECKYSYDRKMPFYRMKVKIKDELVPLGVENLDLKDQTGTYVSPADWNRLIEDPYTLLIDVRNDYEVDIGTFKNALNPKTRNFREFSAFTKERLDPEKHSKVALFCTGGIRCEKASSYMLREGFSNVYQLRGGILKYLEEIPKDESSWEGECFVFDNRTSVNHDLANGTYDLCHNCRYPVSSEDKRSEHYEEGVSCPRCFDKITVKRRRSLEERNRQIKLAKLRDQQHLGVNQRARKRQPAR